MTDHQFIAFPKIPRLMRDIVITEKIDGTNACIVVTDDGKVLAQSRSRMIYPGDDNYGFAAWVNAHEEQLRELGPGHHYGEWWGHGVNRGYGLPKCERRFSLFNVARWGIGQEPRPACCHVVPVLYQGPFDTREIDFMLVQLRTAGSKAAPGFMQPEGVIVFHTAANQMFKITCEHDSEPKNAHVKKERMAQEKKLRDPWTGGRRKGTGKDYAGPERRNLV